MNRPLATWSSLAATVLTLSLASSATAQSTAAAQAESLFRDGLELMETEDHEKACAAFKASQNLDPAAGTLLNLGRCYERSGLTASAWSTYSEAAGLAKRDGNHERAEFARSEATRLEPLVPKILIHVEGLQNDTNVTLDGLVVEHAVLQFEFPVDPGEHEVVVVYSGDPAIKKTFTATPQNGQDPIRLAFEDVHQDVPEPAQMTPTGQLSDEPSAGKTGTSGWSTPRWIGAGVALGGLAGVVVGSVLGAKAMGDARKSDCDATGCSDEGLVARADAQEMLQTGNIVVISGSVLAAGGIALFLFSPSRASSEIAVRAHLPGSGSAGMSVGGTF